MAMGVYGYVCVRGSLRVFMIVYEGYKSLWKHMRKLIFMGIWVSMGVCYY